MEKYYICTNKECKRITISHTNPISCPHCGRPVEQGLESPMSYETKQELARAKRIYANDTVKRIYGLRGKR